MTSIIHCVVGIVFCLCLTFEAISACCPPDQFEGFRYQKMIDIAKNDPYPQVGIDALRFHYDFENEKTLEQFYFNGVLMTQITLYQKVKILMCFALSKCLYKFKYQWNCMFIIVIFFLILGIKI